MMIPSNLADLFRVVVVGGDYVYLQKKKKVWWGQGNSFDVVQI